MPTFDAVPAAITTPPLSAKWRYVSAVGFAPAPGTQAGARSGSDDVGRAPAPPAPPRPPAPAAPRPPPPAPPRPPPPARPFGEPSGSTTTSYFERASDASSVPPHTTSNGNSNRSSAQRVQPDGCEPVGLSHSAILCWASLNASAPGFAFVPSASTPSSDAPVLMIGVAVPFATI